MNTRLLLAWGSLLLGGLVSPVFSAETSTPDPSARANETALAAQQALQAATQKTLMVTGTISKVDLHTGQVEVQTPQGRSTLSLEPETVKGLKVGQAAVVELVPRQE